jgi:hypothetical protein
MLALAARSGRRALWVLALDLLIPPLALYVLVLAAALPMFVAASLVWPVFGPAAWVVVLAAWALALAVGLSWWRYGRHLLSARELLVTPLYALWKLPVYLAYAMHRRSGWVRTRRKSE